MPLKEFPGVPHAATTCVFEGRSNESARPSVCVCVHVCSSSRVHIGEHAALCSLYQLLKVWSPRDSKTFNWAYLKQTALSFDSSIVSVFLFLLSVVSPSGWCCCVLHIFTFGALCRVWDQKKNCSYFFFHAECCMTSMTHVHDHEGTCDSLGALEQQVCGARSTFHQVLQDRWTSVY